MKQSGPKETGSISSDWYASAFGRLYPIVYAHRTVEAAVPEVRFACKAAALAPSDRALDLCCGSGRHLVTLQETGADLTGVDYSPDLLAIARRQVAPATRLIRGDMRRLPFTAFFDAVFSFFTSFGYFFEEADNSRAITELGRVLKPGGRFFMDYLNPLTIEKDLRPDTERTVQDCVIHEKRWIDHNGPRINKQVTVTRNGEFLGSSSESVRLYSVHEMKDMFDAAGLQVVHTWGGYGGDDYAPSSPRMILSGIKVSP